MKAYLVDPFAEEVREIDYAYDGDLDILYQLLECSHVDCIECITQDGIFINDEGLLIEGQKHFLFPGYHSPLAGRGLFVGPTDREGKTTEPTLTRDQVESLIVYGEPAQLNGLSGFCTSIVRMVFDSLQREMKAVRKESGE